MHLEKYLFVWSHASSLRIVCYHGIAILANVFLLSDVPLNTFLGMFVSGICRGW